MFSLLFAYVVEVFREVLHRFRQFLESLGELSNLCDEGFFTCLRGGIVNGIGWWDSLVSYLDLGGVGAGIAGFGFIIGVGTVGFGINDRAGVGWGWYLDLWSAIG